MSIEEKSIEVSKVTTAYPRLQVGIFASFGICLVLELCAVSRLDSWTAWFCPSLIFLLLRCRQASRPALFAQVFLLLLPGVVLLKSLSSFSSERHLLLLPNAKENRTSSRTSTDLSFHPRRVHFEGECQLRRRWMLRSGGTRYEFLCGDKWVDETGGGGGHFQLLLRGAERSWDEAAQIPSGVPAVIEADLQVVRRFAWPWSYGAHISRDGYAAVGELLSLRPLTSVDPRKPSARVELIESLLARFGGPPALAVTLASTLGEESLLNQPIVDLFVDTALMHQLVVSGYQVTLLWTLAEYFLLRVLVFVPLPWLGLFRDRWTGAFSFLLVASYVTLLEEDVPSTRAWMALVLLALGRLLGRCPHEGRALAVLAYALLFVFPGCCFELSFQLTFAALIGLRLGATWSEGRSKWQSLILCHAGPFLTTTPILLVWKQTLVPLGLLLNVLFGTAFSVIAVCLGGLVLIFWSLGFPGAEQLGAVQLWSVEVFLDCLSSVSEWVALHGLGPRELSLFWSAVGSISLFFWITWVLFRQNRTVTADECLFDCYREVPNEVPRTGRYGRSKSKISESHYPGL